MVTVNCFDGARRHSPEAVRKALALPEHVPVVLSDVRDRDSVKEILVRHSREHAPSPTA